MASVSSEKPSTVSRRRSCDTVCSSNSSCLLQKRKQTHPLAMSLRNCSSKSSASNPVKQRVSSARLLKLRSLQSQLNDANFHLMELQQENKALKTLQRRQDKALVKYEGENADLPRLIHSHEEEMRVVQEKNRVLRKNLKETQEQLKIRDEELTHIRDQLKNLTALSKNKSLGERHALSEQVDELKEEVRKNREQLSLLNRKLTLETKNSKQRLNTEISKHKQTQKDLNQALNEIGKLTALLEGKSQRKPLVNIKIHQRKSTVLGDRLTSSSLTQLEHLTIESPEEMSARTDGDSGSTPQLETVKEVDEENADSDRFVNEESNNNSSDLKSLQDLPEIPHKEKPKTVDKRFSDCYTDILTSIRKCSDVVDKRRQEYKEAKSDEMKLRECLLETDQIDAKLRGSDLLKKFPEFDIPEEDEDIVNEIWQSEFEYQKMAQKSSHSESSGKNTKNGSKELEDKNVDDSKAISVNDKSKLLAALKAIDDDDDENFFKFKPVRTPNNHMNIKEVVP